MFRFELDKLQTLTKDQNFVSSRSSRTHPYLKHNEMHV